MIAIALLNPTAALIFSSGYFKYCFPKSYASPSVFGYENTDYLSRKGGLSCILAKKVAVFRS